MNDDQETSPQYNPARPSRARQRRAQGFMGVSGRYGSLAGLALLALAGCLIFLAFAWLEHRSIGDPAMAAADLERTTAQISGLQALIGADAESPNHRPGPALQALRQELNSVISGPGCANADRETLVRSDIMLTQAQRTLERTASSPSDSNSNIQDTATLLSEALNLIAEVSSNLKSELVRRYISVNRRLALSILLAGLAFGAITLKHVLTLKNGGPGGPVPDSTAFPLLLAAAVRNTDEGVLITDTGMQIGEPMILFANDSFKSMSGFEDRELVGEPLRMLRTTSLREKEFSLLEHSYSNSKSATMETIRWRDDGSRVFCEWHISPVRSDDGKVTHFISILMDVTRLREQEEAQRRSKEELLEANRRLVENQQQLIHSEKMAFLGQLAAGVAHEINNPVGYVMSNLETLSDDIKEIENNPTAQSPLTENSVQANLAPFFAETQDILQESISGLERVKDIVQGLKNFARPAEDETKNANINDEIEVALKIVSNELSDKCTVEKHLGDLPTIDCRPGQLNQVFANLLANAGQAIDTRGVITVTTEFTGSEILVKVSDDGIGIEEDNVPRLFAPFFTTKPTGKGTGLGLSVSYGIIQTHNGTIEVESAVGKGSTFIVRLPVASKDMV